MKAREHLLRSLLRLLPEDFRAGYARDMQATFHAEEREARADGGRPALLRLWLATVADILRTAPAAHVDILVSDMRFALRTMAARPLHTLTALLTLAIGIGGSVVMFAVIDGVLLAPLPYRDPASLVSISERNGGEASNVGYLSYVDLRARSRAIATMAAASLSTATLSADAGRDAERVSAMRVSRSYFGMIGVSPALGRAFTEAEDQPGPARRVAVLSDRLWRRRFDSDPNVVGRVVDVSGTPIQVVGVMPSGFEDLVAARLYQGAELWFPLGYDPAASFACRTCRHLRVFGRLAPAANVEAAERETAAIFRSLETEHPKEYHGAGAEVLRLADLFLGPVRPALWMLAAGVAVLLLVACGNVANLVMLRATERTQEIAIRAALGVTRTRLARQLITESLLLALFGGALGLLPAWAAVRLLAIAGPSQLPRLADVGLDARAVAAALAITTLSGLLFGLLPLRQLLRDEHGGSSRRQTASSRTWRVRCMLVAGNMTMALLLLVGSGLLVRSLGGLLGVSPGFDPKGVVTMQVWLNGDVFRSGTSEAQIEAAVRFYDTVLARTRALPGVTAASATTLLPLGGDVDGYGVHVAGRPLDNPEAAPSADRFVVAPEYFATMRISLLRGRFLNDRDRQGGDPVAVINRAAAEGLFPGEDPLGRQVSLGPPTAPKRTIVGVVGDVRHEGLNVPVQFQVYVPQSQWAWAETALTLVVRADGNDLGVAQGVRDLVREIDRGQPVTNVRRYEDVVAASMGTRRFAASLLSAFATAALGLSIVGLYGALGVFVGQRRQEIGVRIALGARAGVIRSMIIAQGMRPVAMGLLAGLGAAALSVRALRSMLYGVSAFDPATFLGAALVLISAATVACALPAWRAARIDPAVTLRAD